MADFGRSGPGYQSRHSDAQGGPYEPLFDDDEYSLPDFEDELGPDRYPDSGFSYWEPLADDTYEEDPVDAVGRVGHSFDDVGPDKFQAGSVGSSSPRVLPSFRSPTGSGHPALSGPLRLRSRGRHPEMRRIYRHRRIQALAAVVIVVLMIPASISYLSALTAPGTAGLALRSIEWIRGHGGAPFMTIAEDIWYSINAPPVGGKPKGPLVPAAVSRQYRGFVAKSAPASSVPTTGTPTGYLPAPPPITPIASPALSGEGVWHPVGRMVNGHPGIYAAFLRPDTVHTSEVAAVAWMDMKLLSLNLFAGGQEPGGSWPLMGPIPSSMRPGLVAAFNSGFRLSEAEGGFYTDGRVGKPLVNGSASLVIFKNGTATVGTWGRDVSMSSNVASVRQNLHLIVDHGQPVAGLRSAPTFAWGATVGGQVLVWRSGIGVTKDGALVYAAGPGLSAYSLADVLAHAGAVRAMELDINTTWVDYFFFDQASGQPASPATGTKLLPGMVRPPQRYFEGTARDFLVAEAR